MSSDFIDPNNHAPEVTPDDDWADAEPSESQGTVLPPRRKATDQPVVISEAANEVGLRIEPRISRLEPSEEPVRLEVQEIGSNVVRLDQEIQGPPKVERLVTFHERPTREELTAQQHDEDDKGWGKAKKLPLRWIIGSAVAVLLLIVLALWLRPAINSSNIDPATASGSGVYSEENESSTDFDNLLFRQTEASQIFRSYAQAVHVNEIVPLVRDGSALKEIMAKHWKPLAVSKQWSPSADSKWMIADLDTGACGLLETTLPNHSVAVAYFTLIDGKCLLDWKATTGYGTASFAELEKGEGDGAEIRGIISEASFYTTDLNEEAFHSYRLIAPDEESIIWCFARRGSIDEWKISKLLGAGEIVSEATGPRKVTLRLVRPEGQAAPNHWQVGEMLHIDWTKP